MWRMVLDVQRKRQFERSLSLVRRVRTCLLWYPDNLKIVDEACYMICSPALAG
jgi:hypothetical protein